MQVLRFDCRSQDDLSLKIPEYALHLAQDLDILDDDRTHGGVLRLEADVIGFKRMAGELLIELGFAKDRGW